MKISSRTAMSVRGSQISWKTLLKTAALATVLVTSSCISADARLNEEDDDSDFFSPPAGARQAPPSFDNGPSGRQGGIRSRDDIPGWQQIRMIPSLSPQQRQEIQKIFLSARQDMAPLREEFTSLRGQAGAGSHGPRGGRSAEGDDMPPMDAGFGGPNGMRTGGGCEGGKGGPRGPGGPGRRGRGGPGGPAGGPGFGGQDVIADSGQGPGMGVMPDGPPGMGFGGPPGRRRRGPGFEMMGGGPQGLGFEGPEGRRAQMGGPPIVDPTVRARLKDIRNRMRTKREEVWQKVQIVLTPQQRTEFQQMRKGVITIPSASRIPSISR